MIYYEDFGALGDGLTNDFAAIKKAHAAANALGEKVYATPGKTYYISETDGDSIIIKTDTSWHGADIIIDDTEISGGKPEPHPNVDVFRVENDFPKITLDESSSFVAKINENRPAILSGGKTETLDLGLGYPALLVVYNDENVQYIRNGFNDKGSPQKEIFIVDERGRIDRKTPALFDYDKITRVEVVRIDTRPITIEGGTVTTLASRQHNERETYREIGRGFSIMRPNTVLVGMKHFVKNQIPKGEIVNGKAFYGDSYGGFYKVFYASNVEIRDSVATSRVMYSASYEIIFAYSNDVRLVNVRQSEENYRELRDWWIMGSNFCKNISYDNCYLTRFDAHCGVYNVRISNSTVASLRLTGGGDFVIENSTVKTKAYGADTFIMLREDYGSTWRGNIYVKNCCFDSIFDTRTFPEVKLIFAAWANRDFGYRTYLPNLFIDNLRFAERLAVKRVKIFDIKNEDENFPEVTNFSAAQIRDAENKNVYTPPKLISIENCDTGIDFALEDNAFFKETVRKWG